MTIQPRSKATVHNRAMNGHITQGPRHRNNITENNPWVPMPHEDREEPHDWAFKYTTNGCLSVSLDCGKCFIDVPQRDVLNGNYDTTCNTSHRNRDGNVIYANFTNNKTGIQS